MLFFKFKRKKLKNSGIPQETLLNSLGLSELVQFINGSSSNLDRAACIYSFKFTFKNRLINSIFIERWQKIKVS